MKIMVGVSARHVHLNLDTYNKLFAESLTKKTALKQPGEFASNQVVTIKTTDGIIKDVRLVGPLRDYNQIEISKTDAFVLKINPPVRSSGDINNTPGITLIGPAGEVTLKEGVIIANRHLHIDPVTAQELNLQNNELVKVGINTCKPGVLMAYVKTLPEASLELHLDVDDANAFFLKTNDEVEFEKF